MLNSNMADINILKVYFLENATLEQIAFSFEMKEDVTAITNLP